MIMLISQLTQDRSHSSQGDEERRAIWSLTGFFPGAAGICSTRAWWRAFAVRCFFVQWLMVRIPPSRGEKGPASEHGHCEGCGEDQQQKDEEEERREEERSAVAKSGRSQE